MYETRPNPVADTEFYNIGGLPSAGNIIEFLPEKAGFWCILGRLYVQKKALLRLIGGGAPPFLTPPL